MTFHAPLPMSSPARAMRGLSLVEMMVAVTIGMILIGSVGYVFLGSRQTFRTLDDFSRIQENVRYVLDQMGVDVRMAGYSGCVNLSAIDPNNPAGPIPINVIANSPPAVQLSQALLVYPDGAGRPAAVPATGDDAGYVAGTDVLQISRAASQGVNLTGNMTTTNANIQINGNPSGFVAGQALLISDCSNADLFRVTNVSSAGGTVTLAHSNAQNSANFLSKAYSTDADVYAVVDTIYYIGSNPAGNPSLYRIQIGGAAEELVENVEDMQFRFGLDTDNNFAINSYAASAGVTDWRQVMSVRASLVFVSNSNNVATQIQPYVVEGVTTTPADRRLRQVATTTFGLRNRLP